ncbi:MAG: DUF1064 domain-containing protein [Candidatus Omnitrophica bacterium]|nr:DUF1064 domain-containing protein [Candidatus Omnitrophota bacterium]
MIRHKFNAKQTIRDGIKFPSKKEARYYDELKMKVEAGIVLFFLRQVPLHLPGGVTMRIDFLEFHTDGTAHFVDTKGVITANWRDKKKIAETLYPIEIEVK